ncbi:MAG: HigA family addiction module antidote protein [Candidatus Gastranaerophilales bacterium]|nr:HigA family addiction module antidote protein [Candidatus Gastranaerophilales bacterium]
MMKNPPHPGEILNELFIKENGLSISKTAMNIGISRQSLSELVNGKNGITAQTALRLSKAFNTSPKYWMNLQSDYDLRKAEKTLNLEEIPALI